jgi:hypothetical protein
MTKDYCEAIESVNVSKKKAVDLGMEVSWTEYKKLRNKCESHKTKLKFESIKEHINDKSINQKQHGRFLITTSAGRNPVKLLK